MSTPPGRSTVRILTLSGAATVAFSLPLFLTGALAVQLTEELVFGATGLGVAVALFRASSAATAGYLGRLADRIGATRSLRYSVAVAVCAALGLAATAVNWGTLVAWLIVGGAAQSLGQPAANRLLINNIPVPRQGIAFGIKQSAPPIAAMIAGLSVPLLAVTFGWRWSYLLILVPGLAVALSSRGGPPVTRGRRKDASAEKLGDPWTLLLLSVSLGFGTSASTTVPAFYVDAAVRGGASPELAGTILAVASVAAVLTRLVVGGICDRMPHGYLRLCSGLLAIGAGGMLLLAVGGPGLMTAGAIVALAGTWGFNGVMWFALMRAFPHAPGAATGAVWPGGLMGGVIGPILFGVLVDQIGYAVAWGVGALFASAAAIGMAFGARRLYATRGV